MGPIDGVNLERVKYFELGDYIDRIKLSSDVLYHASETAEAFDDYIKFLSQYPDSVILDHLISSFQREVNYSNKMEHHIINPESIDKENIFFNSLAMNHQRIKNLHKFCMDGEGSFDYRPGEARVSYFDLEGKEHIYWYGAEAEDIKKFMDAFIKVYKEAGLSQLDSNPFFKSALMSLLFVRIHPFGDGNGRTSRLIYDMKFTEMMNKLYGTNLKISPLHLSMSIYINQPRYSSVLDHIYFDVEHDCNDELNKWFDFMLNMTDEQLYYMTSLESKKLLDRAYIAENNKSSAQMPEDPKISQEIEQMKLNKLLKK